MQSLISLLQWNIGNFDVRPRMPGKGYRGMAYTFASASRDEDLAGIAGVIRAEAPDLVTLQEVVVREEHHRRLAEAAGYELAAAGTADYRHTQALLIRKGRARVLAPLAPPPGVNGVGARLRLELDGRELSVFSNHSDAGIHTRERAAQHRALAAWAAELSRERPFLMGGDFNFDDAPGSLHYAAEKLRAVLPVLPKLVSGDWAADREALAVLRGGLRDLAEGKGPTSGAPRLWPRILLPLGLPLIPVAWALGVARLRSRLDYVFASAPLEAAEARVLRLSGPGSEGHPAAGPDAFPWMDHDPVLVRLNAAS